MKYLLSVFTFVALSANATEYTKHVLDNGLEAYLIQDHRQPIAVHMLWYDIGGADEVANASGIAHLFEHLMFKGTEKIKPQEFSKIIARMGGVDNASTSFDYTNYYQTISIENLDKAMAMEADRMVNLKLDEKNFNTEREVVIQERKQNYENSPFGRFYDKLFDALYVKHPYKIIVIGKYKDIKSLTMDQVLAWYKMYYSPNNAKLLVVGDITPVDFRTMVEKNYGHLKPSEINKPTWAEEPLFSEEKTLVVEDRQVKSPNYFKIFRVPSYFSGLADGSLDRTEVYSLLVLSHLLANSETSYLYQKLVIEQEVINSISADYSPVSKAETTFDLSIQAKDNITQKATEEALEQALASFISEFNDGKKLQNVINQIQSAQIYAKDDSMALARSLGKFLSAGGTVEQYDDFYNQVAKVTMQDIKKVAKKYLNEIQSMNAWLIPEKK